MRYRITLRGLSPLLMHNGAAGLDKRSPANIEKAEIVKKRGSNRTVPDELRLQELECQTGLYTDRNGAPTLPEAAIRAVIETGARQLKQGPQVRQGLTMETVESFDYDRNLGTTMEELGKSTQFTVGVVVQRARTLRTRPKFDDWGVTFTVDVDDDLVDKDRLDAWLDIAGRRIGLGDWRPEKSGSFGRFETVSIDEI